MVFIVIGILIVLILIVFRKYKSVYSVILACAFMTGLTTAVLAGGLNILTGQSTIQFVVRHGHTLRNNDYPTVPGIQKDKQRPAGQQSPVIKIPAEPEQTL
jgi:hypothetical protein